MRPNHRSLTGGGCADGRPNDPGKGADRFSIQTGSGYSRSGTLTGGNVQVG